MTQKRRFLRHMFVSHPISDHRWLGNMSIEDLLQQLSEIRDRKAQCDRRPEWLRSFIQRVADQYEPLSLVGRIGFDCQWDERGWTVCMYMGTTEVIGGPNDGQIDHVDFRIDLQQLMNLFQSVRRVEWYSVADQQKLVTESLNVRSVLAVRGQVSNGDEIQLELLGVPPKFVRPGLKTSDAVPQPRSGEIT
ncbi:MAG: hypothetical protein KDA89_16330 [Planctomycetaceae bacterium]|nr:hypothetical protein [Planctomycetaceae bacterium]